MTHRPVFTHRGEVPELMDGLEVSYREFSACLREIRWVNRYLGGTDALLRHLTPLIKRVPAANDPLTILDVGTGSADIPIALVNWARHHGRKLRVTALDLSDHAIRAARERTRFYPEISVVQGDAMNMDFGANSFDFAISSMFLHHLPTPDAVLLLNRMQTLARHAWVVNDLERHPVAYYAIKALTSLFSRNRLVKHDAPVSVLNAFTAKEAESMQALAGIPKMKVYRRFPYRIVLVGVKPRAGQASTNAISTPRVEAPIT